jgi:hypothetical protein
LCLCRWSFLFLPSEHDTYLFAQCLWTWWSLFFLFLSLSLFVCFSEVFYAGIKKILLVALNLNFVGSKQNDTWNDGNWNFLPKHL